jgi:hypothetical protein
MALPPLPVPLAEMHPSLCLDPSFSDAALGAYELLLLGCGSLGAGVRVSEVVPGGAADRAGLKVGDVMFTCNGQLLLGTRIASTALRSAADAHSQRALITLLDGREFVLAGRSAQAFSELLAETDVLVALPHERGARVTELQLLVLHCLCDAVDFQLMGDPES